MTDKPEGIKTFMDCPYWRGKFNGMIDGRDHCLQHFLPCRSVRLRGECKMGYAP
jgi:hypothetical protein